MNLPHRIQLVSRETVTTDDFEEVESWVPGPPIRARVKQTAAGEALQNQREVVKTVLNITVRYRTTINEQMRLIYQGRTYEINGAVDANGLRQSLQITATLYE